MNVPGEFMVTTAGAAASQTVRRRGSILQFVERTGGVSDTAGSTSAGKLGTIELHLMRARTRNVEEIFAQSRGKRFAVTSPEAR